MKKHEFKIGDEVVCMQFPHFVGDLPGNDVVINIGSVGLLCRKPNGDIYSAHKSIVKHVHVENGAR